MDNNIDKGPAINLHFRFGQIAVDEGFVTEDQLKQVLAKQIANDPSVRLRPHKLIGEIFQRKVG